MSLRTFEWLQHLNMAASSSDHNVTETALDAVKCKLYVAGAD